MSRLVARANLRGRVAAIIGGGGGIGAAVTLALANESVHVALCDIDEACLDLTSAAALAAGVRVLGTRADATDVAQLETFYKAIAESFGQLDVVVNVAGGTQRRRFEDEPSWDAADIDRNYRYVLNSIRCALPLLRKGTPGGSIINFTSIEAHRGAATFAVYAGAKAATTNFSRALAVELAHERIRVNCIAPDTTPSRGNAAALTEADRIALMGLPEDALRKGLAMYIPMRRAPEPADLADAVVFLASDLSSCVTGTTLHVDGGANASSGFIHWPEGDGYVPAPLGGTIRRLFAVKGEKDVR
ncbi:MAG: SDR family oxidoreductase [Rhodospirillaceae bacterium]|nr:MAG: SDR family oxidoreductase [Rhodospirillaceae bacterium]